MENAAPSGNARLGDAETQSLIDMVTDGDNSTGGTAPDDDVESARPMLGSPQQINSATFTSPSPKSANDLYVQDHPAASGSDIPMLSVSTSIPRQPLSSMSNEHRPTSVNYDSPVSSATASSTPKDDTVINFDPAHQSWPFVSPQAVDSNGLHTTPSPVYTTSPTMVDQSYADPSPAHSASTTTYLDTSTSATNDDIRLTLRPSSADSSSVTSPLLGADVESFSTAARQNNIHTTRFNNNSEYRRLSHSPQVSTGTHSLLNSNNARLSSASLSEMMDSTTSWLILYFCFNLGLTLFNKLVLQGFPFPWTLTGIQMLSGTIGTQISLKLGFFQKSELTMREAAIMVAFSVLYTINIAVSNLSLNLVTIPVRSSCVFHLLPSR
jgi:hypothetical protein